MKYFIALMLLFSATLNAKYLDSKSCQECHEDIHYEHMKSMHAKSSLFHDEVHRKVKNAVDKDKYSCALCHMPATKNLASMIRGIEQPDESKVRQSDGVSCLYCHQIRELYQGKKYTIHCVNSITSKKTYYVWKSWKP